MRNVYEKKIDWVFFNERQIEKAVWAARVDNPRAEIPVISPNNFSDPTANIVLHNLTPLKSVIVGQKEIITKKHERRLVGGETLEYPELWLAVISKTYAWCKRQSESHEQAIRKKYQGEHYLRICRELSISQTTLKNWVSRTRMYAALQAAQLRLIYVD